MTDNDFESAFSHFLDGSEYEYTEEALFRLVRAAFAAGWKAAGGKPLRTDNIYRMFVNNDTKGIVPVDTEE